MRSIQRTTFGACALISAPGVGSESNCANCPARPKSRQSGPAAKQIRARPPSRRSSNVDHARERAFDDRRCLRRRADMMQPPDHARAHRLLDAFRRLSAFEQHVDDALGGAFLIFRIAPAIMEHRLVEPFVGIVFDQRRHERERGIVRRDRRLGILRLQRLDHRRGILQRVVVGIDQHRRQRQLGVARELFLARIWLRSRHSNSQPLEAQIGTHLHRVRRKLCAIEAERSGHRDLQKQNRRAATRAATESSNAKRADQTGLMFTAAGLFLRGSFSTSNDTAWPSRRPVRPERSTALTCTNTSCAAFIRRDETETLRHVEPLHDARSHRHTPRMRRRSRAPCSRTMLDLGKNESRRLQ